MKIQDICGCKLYYNPVNKIELKRTTSASPDFGTLIIALDADLRTKYGELMNLYDQHNIIEQIDTVIIAFLNGQPIGCGCFKPYDPETVEVKRMYVAPQARGKGMSKLILGGLEDWAKELNFPFIVLETGSKQIEAIGLYQKMGYIKTPPYGPYVDLPDSVCFRKMLS